MDAYQEYLIRYLNKNYYLKNNTFFERPDNPEWGQAIVKDINKIFDFNIDICEETFKIWAHSIGFPQDKSLWDRSYAQQRLKAQYSRQLTESYNAYLGLDWEERVMTGLYNIINDELKSEFLRNAVLTMCTIEELIGALRCEGYVLGPSLFSSDSYLPKQSFISITYDELLNERQTNIRWQNWLRSRKCD